jgi:hypothetical protein
VRPLVAEWDAARARIAAAMAERAKLARDRARAGAETLALAGERGITAESFAAWTTLRLGAGRRTRKLAPLLLGRRYGHRRRTRQTRSLLVAWLSSGGLGFSGDGLSLRFGRRMQPPSRHFSQ